MPLVPILDRFEFDTIARLKKGLVDEPAHLNSNWLDEHHWKVVPVESAGHFDESDANILSKAFMAVGCRNVFAIATEEFTNHAACYDLCTTKEDLIAFSNACGVFNFVLVPIERCATVLCTVFDYYLVAGPEKFVASAVGGNIDGAWKTFEEEASESVWEGRLRKIADRYRVFR